MKQSNEIKLAGHFLSPVGIIPTKYTIKLAGKAVACEAATPPYDLVRTDGYGRIINEKEYSVMRFDCFYELMKENFPEYREILEHKEDAENDEKFALCRKILEKASNTSESDDGYLLDRNSGIKKIFDEFGRNTIPELDELSLNLKIAPSVYEDYKIVKIDGGYKFTKRVGLGMPFDIANNAEVIMNCSQVNKMMYKVMSQFWNLPLLPVKEEDFSYWTLNIKFADGLEFENSNNDRWCKLAKPILRAIKNAARNAI